MPRIAEGLRFERGGGLPWMPAWQRVARLAELERGDGWIESTERREGDDGEERKVYVPRYEVRDTIDDEPQEGARRYESIAEALEELRERPEATDNGYYEPMKEVYVTWDEKWVDADGYEVEDGREGLRGEDIDDCDAIVEEYGDGVEPLAYRTWTSRDAQRGATEESVRSAAREQLDGLVIDVDGRKLRLDAREAFGKKYSTVKVIDDASGERVGEIQLRLADHSRNPGNDWRGGEDTRTVSVVLNSTDPTEGRWHGGDLRYGEEADAERIVDDVRTRIEEIVAGESWGEAEGGAAEMSGREGERDAEYKKALDAYNAERSSIAYATGVDIKYPDPRGGDKTMRLHSTTEEIDALPVVKIASHSLTREEQKEKYYSFAPITNIETGERVEFYHSAFGKNHREGGLFEKIVSQIRQLFRDSKLAYSEPEQLSGAQRPDGSKHKEHRSFIGYGNYLAKAEIDGKEYYVRFTVQRKKGESGLHSSFVSNVDLYENPVIVAYGPSSNGGRRLDYDRIVDAKLKLFLDNGKENADKIAEAKRGAEKTKKLIQSEAKMRNILDEVKRERGYTADSGYQGSLAFNGAAPSDYGYSKEERKEMWDNDEWEGDQTLGDYVDNGIDVSDLAFKLEDPRAYRTADTARKEAINNLRKAIESGKHTITMYRAVDADIEEGAFRNGDWVTPSKEYAEQHIKLQDWKEGRVIEQEVSIDDVWWDGNDIAEWGYDDGKGYAYKNTENNRKLDDLITYDDEGNVIPPSQRFNESSSDERYRLREEAVTQERQAGAITDEQVEALNAEVKRAAREADRAEMRSAVQRMGERFHTPVNIIEDVNEITHPNAAVQKRRRKSKGWYDTATGEVYIVLDNNIDIDDAIATAAHETIAHKGLRELVGEERYGEFLDEVYRHLRDDLKKGVDDAAGRAFIDDTTKNGKRAKRYEHHKRRAVDELFGRLAEKPFDEMNGRERTLWQKLKATVRRLLDKFLGSLRLPKMFELGDNELRYMLWRSKERLERKGGVIETARDEAKRAELGLTDESGDLYRDPDETEDIWTDGSLGLDEQVTRAAVRLAGRHRESAAAKQAAYREIGGNLTKLRQAMALQKRFDRTTVKRVADLARVLISGGYLNELSGGEVKRLLSAVKNSTGHNDIEADVQKVMDIMVDNQLKQGEAALRELEAMKGSKVDAIIFSLFASPL